ncbi:MAG: hypothetical protein WC180_04160 [Candidatus Paceibacterota bacterium]
MKIEIIGPGILWGSVIALSMYLIFATIIYLIGQIWGITFSYFAPMIVSVLSGIIFMTLVSLINSDLDGECCCCGGSTSSKDCACGNEGTKKNKE